jgi:DNA gyrase/topoisomerase IV subunit A
MSIKDMYKVKKKRAVDPNAPPRPNLLSHEKVLKDTKLTIEQMQQEHTQLRNKIAELERKMVNQTAYMSALHHQLVKKNN